MITNREHSVAGRQPGGSPPRPVPEGPRDHAPGQPGNPGGLPLVDGTTMAQWLRGMLDEIDYGMLLIDADGHLLYANHAAQAELDARHPLQITPQGLRTQRLQDAAPLADALAGALRGRRKLLMLGEGSHRACLSVVPLPGGASGPGTLLVLGKRQVCEQLTVQGYARSVGLTAAETRVLEGLCAGVRPREIAERQGVAVSTVRTQIGSIRAKTGVASIRELVRQVAVLPPLVGALKSGHGGAGLAVVPVLAWSALDSLGALGHSLARSAALAA